jgi:Txe/YoeB family toxin of Txe-Axe toxin-antitoxin module
MQLIFNELSLLPLTESVQVAEMNFRAMIGTFKKAKEIVGFKNILFQNNLSSQPVVEQINFVQFLDLLENKDLKKALITFLKPPYLDDLSDAELEEFYSSEYQITEEGCPTTEAPYGFPIAYIKSVPTISLNTHAFWNRLMINLTRIVADEPGNASFSVSNICQTEHVDSQQFKNWISVSLADKIEDKEALGKYLGYTKYSVHFKDDFFTQLMDWKKENQKFYKYTLALMKDVELHPFTGGMGQTENLKNRGKEASKRISNSYPSGDRLSYTVENNVVTFIACKGHYKFH